MALEAVNVHGGYRIMDVSWFRNRDEDMDADFDWIEESETLYPTKAEADAAIAGLAHTVFTPILALIKDMHR